MKTSAGRTADESRGEYDFAAMTGGVRGKHAKRYHMGTNLVLLAPDVAEVFRDNTSVNEALRTLIGVVRAQVPRRKSVRRRSLHPAT
jgi:hypothetical protein